MNTSDITSFYPPWDANIWETLNWRLKKVDEATVSCRDLLLLPIPASEERLGLWCKYFNCRKVGVVLRPKQMQPAETWTGCGRGGTKTRPVHATASFSLKTSANTNWFSLHP